jgi:UDP-N-acetylglucosamine 2-epimerase (non-hydrolysing)
MPEEINRILTDAISRWLFVSEPSGIENLRREGIPDENVHYVGNVMIDTLVACRPQFAAASLAEVDMPEGQYAVLTLHRPVNVDHPATLRSLMEAIEIIQRDIPLVFPVHPRTRKALAESRVKLPNVRLAEPLGYLEFMKLVTSARFVLTDSGGIQEETTYLGVPCLTLRDSTERPSTIEQGTNVLVGSDPKQIISAAQKMLQPRTNGHRIPKLWDGQAAPRILDVLTASA